jgi:hypothetical protein
MKRGTFLRWLFIHLFLWWSAAAVCSGFMLKLLLLHLTVIAKAGGGLLPTHQAPELRAVGIS